jgi:LuxR family transcriptional regulator, maltose regulon positive regulatory protein
MGTQVVATRRRIIRRPRLTKLLDESPARIKLLIAPAGYGKTTLAHEWLSDPTRHDVWYRGGPASADVAALAAGLSIAASAVLPDTGKRMRGWLRGSGTPEESVDVLADLLSEDLQSWPANAWLAIDDYQCTMESAASERLVDVVVTTTPLRLLITSRRRPSWATARRILYGEIQEIDRRTLAMKRAEANQVLGTTKSAEGLIERARGWPAVLGLAALTSYRTIPSDDLPDELYAYFAEELYRGAAAKLRDALHRLALVPSVTLASAHLLLGPQASIVIDDCFRIGALTSDDGELLVHPLLRTFLNKKLARENPETLRETADEVARLLVAQQRWDAAFHVISSHGSPDLVVPLIETAQAALLAEGRTQTLLSWLDFAGDNHFAGAALDFAEAEVLFRQGQYAKAEVLASQAADESADPQSARMLIRAGQAAVMDSHDEQGLEYFRKARRSATAEPDRFEAAVGICFAALELGLNEEATEAVRDVAAAGPRGIDAAARRANVELAYSSRLGGIESSLTTGARVMALIDDATDPLVVTSFLNSYAYILALGAYYSEALEVAERETLEAEQYRILFALPHAFLTKAVSYCGLRDFAKASAEIDKAEASAGPADIHVSVRAAALRTRIALSRRNLPEAGVHSSKSWERPASPSMTAEYLAYRALTYACLGNDRGAQETVAKVRMIPATSVETMTLAACADAVSLLATASPAATSSVLSAFALIEETGGLDILVTVGRAYAGFLKALLADEGIAATIHAVLSRSNDFRLGRALGLDIDSGPKGPYAQLTQREHEVGHLVAQGFTNREIAERLFISTSTVKVHVRHILEKMNARTRAEIAGRLMTDEHPAKRPTRG